MGWRAIAGLFAAFTEALLSRVPPVRELHNSGD